MTLIDQPTTAPDPARSTRIAELNDRCRQQPGVAGRWVATPGIQALPDAERRAIIAAIRTFNSFPIDNNPYGERDFGAFTHGDESIVWKIDYYDRNLEYASDDPSDPDKTIRVLTVMLASDY